jgi:hypothetical protein
LELVDNPPPQMMYFWSEELKAKEKLALVLLGRIIDRSDDYLLRAWWRNMLRQEKRI